MALMNSIKRLFGGSSAEQSASVPVPPKPTSLTERQRQGKDIGSGSHQDAIEAAKRESQNSRRNDDPYSTAAWEVDPTSGRKRLSKTNPLDTNKGADPNNPYDTSTELDPWKRG